MSNNRAEIEQAMQAWREDEERVLGGQCLSAETRADAHAAHSSVDRKKLQQLAENHPEMFMSLVDTVSPVSQDVLIQYYLLRRTQEQIGILFGITKHALHYTLTRAIDELKGARKATKRDWVREKVEIRREKWLGAEEIPIEESVLEMCFQPTNGNV